MFVHTMNKDDHHWGYIIPLEMGDTSVTRVWANMNEFLAADLNGDGITQLFGFRYTENRLEELSFGGSVLNTYPIGDDSGGEQFRCRSISAYDVDEEQELIVFGVHWDGMNAQFPYRWTAPS